MSATRLPPLVAIVFALVSFFLLRSVTNIIGQSMDFGTSGTHVLLKALLLSATFLVASYHPSGIGLLGVRRPRGQLWIVIVITGLAAGAITTFVMLLARTGGHPLMKQLSLFEVVLTIWLLSSVSEEFYCRGLIQPWIDDGDDRWWTHPATLASALIFGAMHLTLLSDGADATFVGIIVLATTFLGFLCAVTRRASRSIWTPIATHVAFNVGGVAGAVVAVLVLGREILSSQM